jgi:2-methylcitrate dehydratase PrpD
MQYDHGGGSVKRIFTGVGASSGIQSAELARAGMTGPEGILEGARGLLRIYTRAYKPERLAPRAGGKWIFEHIQFKPYCCCGIIHPSIDGLTKIMAAHGLGADDIASVTISNPSGFHAHANITSPHDLLGMQFSTSYSLALTAIRGGNTPREYTTDALTDPAIKAFAARVTVREGPELNKICDGHFSAHVKVCSRAGAVHEELVIDAKGSTAVPLTDGDIDNKFRSQAEGNLGTENCESLLQMVRSIDALDDVGKLFSMLVAKSAAGIQINRGN